MAVGSYHLLELQIASDPADSRRVMPAIRSEHRRILDVGCGAGQTLLASALGREVTAIGIDRDAEALKLGRRLGEKVQFVCARGETLPVRSDHFDLVISRVALPYMKTRAALAEMARVVRPGGSLWIALHPAAREIDALVASVKRLRLREALHRLYVLANGALAHLSGREFPVPLKGRYQSFQTEARVVRQLRELGFETIRVQKRVFFVVTATKPVKRGEPT